jgi:hypothetical protein
MIKVRLEIGDSPGCLDLIEKPDDKATAAYNHRRFPCMQCQLEDSVPETMNECRGRICLSVIKISCSMSSCAITIERVSPRQSRLTLVYFNY